MLVALGVSGGIAAYKAAEIVRGLTKAGAEVQVLMTENAGRFVTALTLQTLSGRKVFSDAWEAEGDVVVRHIDLARRIEARPEVVRRLFTAGDSNPTLATVIKLAEALGDGSGAVGRSSPQRHEDELYLYFSRLIFALRAKISREKG